ncbi:MAG: hypothetical protein LBR46_08675 [Prevotella sp.]|nr:hypothetical protein [Prevotella sp.]
MIPCIEYRGYPVGYLLLWANANTGGSRYIGTDGRQKYPNQMQPPVKVQNMYKIYRFYGKMLLINYEVVPNIDKNE